MKRFRSRRVFSISAVGTFALLAVMAIGISSIVSFAFGMFFEIITVTAVPIIGITAVAIAVFLGHCAIQVLGTSDQPVRRPPTPKR